MINKIYNAECLEFMRSMPANSVDLVVTDPPYEIATKGGGLGKRPVYENGALDKISQGLARIRIIFIFAYAQRLRLLSARVNT